MPTREEREYYRMGFSDGMAAGSGQDEFDYSSKAKLKTGIKKYAKRKLSAWNKYVKANSKKPRFRYRNGKLNLKKMAVAFRKTPAGKKKRR
jgi:hypothetical protein